MSTAPYSMPPGPHTRRHGATGYLDYKTYKEWLRDEFQFRCVFCLHREKWERRGWRVFHIDHIIPRSQDATKIALYENVLYVCDSCNIFKSDTVLPDPCELAYADHYRFEADGTVTSLSDLGKMYIEILGLDEPDLVKYRKKWFKLIEEYKDACAQLDEPDRMKALETWLGYPEDIPDLRLQRPKSNTKRGSQHQTYYVWLENGQIPRIY